MPPIPKQYQEQGIWAMIHDYNGRCLNADDAGLGKSMQSLYASLPYRHKRPVVIVCPASVKWSWEEEIKKHLNMHSWVLEGRNPNKVKHPLTIPPFIIVNWDILDAWCDYLISLRPNVVIPDECQYAKTRSAKRTRALVRLCRNVPFLYPLSATPIENRPREFFVILNLLWPKEFPRFSEYGLRYCGARLTPWGMKYDGATRKKELRRRLLDLGMIRRRKADVLKELPKLQRVIVPIDIEKRKEYDDAERNIVAWLYKNRPSKAKRSAKVVQLTKFNYLLQLCGELKLKAVMQWIDNFLETTNRKLVVFGYHRKFLKPLYAHYKRQAVIVDGSVVGRKRKVAIDRFASNKGTRLFFGQIRAAGVGINKLTAASDVVIGEMVWVPTWLEQVEARLYRLGQKRRVTAHYLIARNTAEHSLCRSVYNKQSTLDQIMDGTDKQQFDIFEEVLQDIRRKRR